MAAIFWVSSIAAIPRLPEDVLDTAAKKLAHFVEYAVLGALLYRGLSYQAAPLNPGSEDRWGGWPRMLLSAGIGGLYGVSDELHQSLVVGRHPAPLDAALDTFGALVGSLASARWLGPRAS